MTKYEGKWFRDQKHGNGFAIFSDGSIYDGSFSKDEINGLGKFEWPQGHCYSGSFKAGKMDGTGSFNHSSGRCLRGKFKNNLYQHNTCFLNPMDDEKTCKRTEERLLKELYKDPAALEIQQRMSLFRIHGDDEWSQAVQATQEAGRVPLMIRTPRCHYSREQAIEKLIAIMELAADHQEINLRQMYFEAGKDSELKL